MSKKSHLTQEERAIHDRAVKIRKLTDQKLCDLVDGNANRPQKGDGQTKGEIVDEFIGLCENKGRRLGPATIHAMRNVARDAGYDLGV